MRDWSAVVPHTVEITSSNGTLTHTYFVGGLRRPWDDEAKRFLATQLPMLVRRSGLGAESRVKSIFEKKGVNGVLEEIDLLGGDYARRLYFVALIDVAAPRRGCRAAGAAARRSADEVRLRPPPGARARRGARARSISAAAAAYVQAMATMKSDYDQRQALTALTKRNGAAVDGDTLAAGARAHEVELRQADGARTDAAAADR